MAEEEPIILVSNGCLFLPGGCRSGWLAGRVCTEKYFLWFGPEEALSTYGIGFEAIFAKIVTYIRWGIEAVIAFGLKRFSIIETIGLTTLFGIDFNFFIFLIGITGGLTGGFSGLSAVSYLSSGWVSVGIC